MPGRVLPGPDLFRLSGDGVEARLMYQGLAWVDAQSYQIVRMRTDLLAPRGDVGLGKSTLDIRYSGVRFDASPRAYWLPQEVLVTLISGGQTFRNRHRYSEYRVFTVESFDKVEPPKIKK